jgi:hypothetical protein
MHNWFEGVVKYEKTAEEGKIVSVSEHYLIDALTHAEAESRLTEEMKPFISGQFTGAKLMKKKINEMFYNENGDKWYKAKVMFVSLDEEKGIEKRTATTMMVQANDIKEAWDGLHEGMKGTMADYSVASITETNIMDVYKYEADEAAA